ncbi:low-specificity L-threonine aldolase [Candidatus Bipolaricaulota bacterium]|nr:low-specificity L-threonine aldolase [Candidatus Bipolaricaulota bacterium]
MKLIDLRSDTVTRPTDGMRQAMAAARVGDDVFEEDPTVNELEARMAALLGKEAGLFVASGTMGNLVAMLSHADRGDEIILGNLSHTFLYEAGGCAALGGIHPHVLPNEPDGTLDLEAIELAIRNANDPHQPPTRMIVLENTHNRCGGVALSLDYCDAVAAVARKHGLTLHLDGARLFNAAVALIVEPAALAAFADSVTVCLSKALGAPVGSVLCGTREFIRRARRMRKIVGGGMRQVGILAAAGLYALDHHIERLAEDHENARVLASGVDRIEGLSCPQAHASPGAAWTNLVYVHVDGRAVGMPELDAAQLTAQLREAGVLAIPLGRDGRQMRMVTHIDVDRTDIETALAALQSALVRT